ncbi:MAG: VOC family protein [Rubrivivax sp.]
MTVQSYLFFDGRCEQAVAFYGDALGAQVQHLARYRESPEPLPPGMVPDGWGDKVMHVSLTIGDSVVMACDSSEAKGFTGFSMSIGAKDESEADRMFAALADGGKVTMPLAKTFWSAKFGMLTDRFGVPWMVNVDH